MTDVVGGDNNLFAPCTFGEEVLAIPALRKDMHDLEASDLQGVDTALHLAALYNDQLGDLNPEVT